MQSKISYRNLPQLFLKAREELLCYFRPILTHFGLTEQQWRIMRALNAHQQLESREIGDLCQILSPSLAGMLARMEHLGLLSRHRVTDDLRRRLVRLTPKGKRLVSAIAPLIEAQYRHIESALGNELLQELYVVMDKLLLAQRVTIARVPLPTRSKERLSQREETE